MGRFSLYAWKAITSICRATQYTVGEADEGRPWGAYGVTPSQVAGEQEAGEGDGGEEEEVKGSVKKQIVAGSQAGPANSTSETSSDEDTRPLAKLSAAKTGGAGAKRNWLNKITYMKLVEEFAKVEDLLLPWAKTEKAQLAQLTVPTSAEQSAQGEENQSQTEEAQIFAIEHQAHEQPAEETTTVMSEHQAQEHQAQEEEHQAHEEERRAQEEEQPAQEVEHQAQAGSSPSSPSAWLRPVSRGNRHFTVGGGRLRQSGPRPEGRLLRQPALEGMTRSARTDSPHQVGRNKFRRERRRRRRRKAVTAAQGSF
ncbi:hypothetical protein F511_16881 [Dorcoceras hygrometricum]|uniref:Uncharacterized protein n=1 Tax=Dorcoceras hygrometricum TaxID=472368 RepID=A0A2Z7DDM7_9LAMI|nr:hypothetical protein F511_16881 [Dorcoceras hygrometricum]